MQLNGKFVLPTVRAAHLGYGVSCPLYSFRLPHGFPFELVCKL